jgi:hypothetical protein
MLEFPTIYKRDIRGDIRQWRIVVLDPNTLSIETGIHPSFSRSQRITVDDGNADQEASTRWSTKVTKESYVSSVDDLDKNFRPMFPGSWALKHQRYPAQLQPHLANGFRCIARLNENESSVTLTSVTDTALVGFCTLESSLCSLLLQHPTLVLDGHLFRTEWPLERVSGIVRDQSSWELKKELLYMISDVVYMDNVSLSFQERFNRFRRHMSNKRLANVVVSPTITVNTPEHISTHRSLWYQSGYAGVVFRNSDAPYKLGCRSTDVQIQLEPKTMSVLVVNRSRDQWLCSLKSGLTFWCQDPTASTEEWHQNRTYLTVSYERKDADGRPIAPEPISLKTYDLL